MRLARREGFGPFAGQPGRAGPPTRIGVRLRRVLEEAGGVYVKLGQIAATRVDLLPPEICDELAKLQNRVAPEPAEQHRRVLEAELGDAVDEVFAEFDWEPLAAASIGQTYRARLRIRRGRRRQGPAARHRRRSSSATSPRSRCSPTLAQRRTAFGQGVRSGEMLDQFAESLRAELDFRREADAMAEMAPCWTASSPVRVPEVHRQLCTRRLLVQERFDGFTLADTDALDDAAIDRDALADQLLRATLDQVLRLGFFHADPHPGQHLRLRRRHARADRLRRRRAASTRSSRPPIVDMLAAFVQRDVSLLRDGSRAGRRRRRDRVAERLERALARLMAEHVRPDGAVDPTVMQDLVRVLSEFGIRLPADLVLLSRALVTLDGTLRSLAPGRLVGRRRDRADARRTTAPIVDRDDMIRDELLAALPHLRHLPDRVDRILTLTGRGELRIRSVVDEDGQRIVRTLVNRALLAADRGRRSLVAGGPAADRRRGRPAVAEGTGLFEIFGYGGLLAATVLLLRVVAARRAGRHDMSAVTTPAPLTAADGRRPLPDRSRR